MYKIAKIKEGKERAALGLKKKTLKPNTKIVKKFLGKKSK